MADQKEASVPVLSVSGFVLPTARCLLQPQRGRSAALKDNRTGSTCWTGDRGASAHGSPGNVSALVLAS